MPAEGSREGWDPNALSCGRSHVECLEVYPPLEGLPASGGSSRFTATESLPGSPRWGQPPPAFAEPSTFAKPTADKTADKSAGRRMTSPCARGLFVRGDYSVFGPIRRGHARNPDKFGHTMNWVDVRIELRVGPVGVRVT